MVKRRQARQRQRLEALQKSAESYTAKAVQLGIKPDELEAAGKFVHSYGISDDLRDVILADETGPLITKYLSLHEDELDELVRMHPIQAALRIERQIKPKAAALKPRVSNAPEPPESVRNSATALKSLGPEGVTYE